jgi:iron only hydrogenase large subunit-like protein
MTLEESSCILCGRCADVCPVGAIYEHMRSTGDLTALINSEHYTAVQINPMLCAAFDNEMGLSAGTLSPGKIVTALKRLGFNMVFDAVFFENAVLAEVHRELENRIQNGGVLPLISGCSQSWNRFAEHFYPDLSAHFSTGKNPQEMFGDLLTGFCPDNTRYVSIEPCIAKKTTQPANSNAGIVLTLKELARVIKLAGIDIAALPESPFDEITVPTPEIPAGKGLVVYGLADARKIMDSIRKGECDADFVKITYCPQEKSCADDPG